MIPTIIVFVSNPVTSNESKTIETLKEMGYFPFVDSLHGKDYNWLKNNTNCPHILFSFKNCVGVQFSDLVEYENEIDKIDILIAFNTDLDENLRKDINQWLRGIDPTSLEFRIDLPQLEKPITAPDIATIKNTDLFGEEPTIVNYPDCYGFRQIFNNNVAFYEITKPHTDRPFSTYVEDYKNHPKDLFSNFFICTQWAVCDKDIAFLKELWAWKMMDTKEEFNIDKLVRDHILRCKNGEPEPKVYRKTLEDVIERYIYLLENCGTKRKTQDLDSSKKKLK